MSGVVGHMVAERFHLDVKRDSSLCSRAPEKSSDEEGAATPLGMTTRITGTMR